MFVCIDHLLYMLILVHEHEIIMCLYKYVYELWPKLPVTNALKCTKDHKILPNILHKKCAVVKMCVL